MQRSRGPPEYYTHKTQEQAIIWTYKSRKAKSQKGKES